MTVNVWLANNSPERPLDDSPWAVIKSYGIELSPYFRKEKAAEKYKKYFGRWASKNPYSKKSLLPYFHISYQKLCLCWVGITEDFQTIDIARSVDHDYDTIKKKADACYYNLFLVQHWDSRRIIGTAAFFNYFIPGFLSIHYVPNTPFYVVTKAVDKTPKCFLIMANDLVTEFYPGCSIFPNDWCIDKTKPLNRQFGAKCLTIDDAFQSAVNLAKVLTSQIQAEEPPCLK